MKISNYLYKIALRLGTKTLVKLEILIFSAFLFVNLLHG